MDEKGSNRKNFPKLATRFGIALLLCCAMCQSAAADDEAAEASRSLRAVVPVGQTVGIKMYSEGLLVVELSQVGGEESPAKAAGLRVGDFIVSADGEKLGTAEQLAAAVSKENGAPMEIKYTRNGRTMSADAVPARDGDGEYRLGAWVRDSMAGIGTVTFYDEDTGVFGALGHGITDVDTSLLMPLSSGSILDSTVTAVKKGKIGNPGQLKGDINAGDVMGSITCNTSFGVFGTSNGAFCDGKAVPVASDGEVHTGKAVILSNIDGDEAKEYEIEILKLMPDARDGRDMLIRITDAGLLAKTGGIVQGMSGSPILQNGKIVGAVTHVLVNNPAEGYGILISNMLDEVLPNVTENAS